MSFLERRQCKASMNGLFHKQHVYTKMHYFERKQKLWCISHDLFGLWYRKRIGAGWHGGGSVVLQSLRINWSCCKKKIRRFKFGKGLEGSVSIIYHRDLGSAPWMHLIGREKAERKLSNLIHLRDTRRLEVVGGKTELKCMFALLPTFLNTMHTWGEGIPRFAENTYYGRWIHLFF